MEPVKINIDELGLYVLACEAVASHVGVFRGARFSTLPT